MVRRRALHALAIVTALAAPACSLVLGLEEAGYDSAACGADEGVDCALDAGAGGSAPADDAGHDAADDVAPDDVQTLDAPEDAPTCGDGVIDPGEACDDGNAVAGDGCTSCRVDCLALAFEEPMTGRCFWVAAGTHDWNDAVVTCLDTGGRLASVDTPAELAFVAAHLAAPSWTSANDLATPGAFAWSGGGPVASDLWAAGEPDHPQSSRCVALVPSPAGLATDPCAQKMPAVCERVPGP